MIIAITGSIGSGKSGVARYLAAISKAEHCDTDVLCRDLLEKGQPGWRSVVEKWGNRFVEGDGSIDRSSLRIAIFEDERLRRELENMLHPHVQKAVNHLYEKILGQEQMATFKNGPFLQSLRCARKFYPRNINYMSPVKFPHAPRPWRKNLIFQGSQMLIVEIPLLFEVGWQDDFDCVVTVFAEREVCVQRVMARDAVTAEQAEKVYDSQMDIHEKMNRSDCIVDNSASLENMQRQVEDLFRDLHLQRNKSRE